MSTMMTFSIFGVIFLATGIVLRVLSEQITEINVRYDNNPACSGKTSCNVDLATTGGNTIPKITAPIYVYYQLDNFYQNHRRYVKSRDNEQLYGAYKTAKQLSNCDPITKNDQLWPTQQYSLTDKLRVAALSTPKNCWDIDPSTSKPYCNTLTGTDPAIPCGLVAKSVFNDTFELWKKGGNSGSDTNITISIKNIAWSSDLTYKFKNTKTENLPKGVASYKDIQWYDMQDEHFIVWMRTAGLPNFRKLWGKLDKDLEEGEYQVRIKNNYKVDSF